jgi:hypothetical protein
MMFTEVRSSLVAVLRSRVRNGELTERGLAKLVGVSQPHIHNVLKGARALSPELSDQILQHLRLSLLDLIERDYIKAYLNFDGPGGGYVYVPVLRGNIGPACPWPTEAVLTERMPFHASQVASIDNPVAVRLAEDARMLNTFSAGDVALLDQSHRARSNIEPAAYYVVKCGSGGVVRRLQLSENTLYLIPEDARKHPPGWHRIALNGRQLTHFIRARAYLTTPLYEWNIG